MKAKIVMIVLIGLLFLSGCVELDEQNGKDRNLFQLDDGIIIRKFHIPETSETAESYYFKVKDVYHTNSIQERDTIEINSKEEYDSYKAGDFWVRPVEEGE